MRSKKLIYPGIVKGKALVNLESMTQPPMLNYVFIEFNIGDLNNQKRSESIPKGSIITTCIIRVEEGFNGSVVEFCLGLSTIADVGFANIDIPGIVNFYSATANKFLRVLENNEVLHYIVVSGGVNAPTQGKGWCLLSYINVNVL